MFDPSAEKFAALGENQIAYIKAIRSEEVAFLSAQAPLLPAGYRVFVLYAADGTPLQRSICGRLLVSGRNAHRALEYSCGPWCDVGWRNSRRSRR
jgi:hypothetical protein